MNTLLNVPFSLFEHRSAKNYTGPLHFSSLLIKEFTKRKEGFTAIVFEKTKPHPKTFFKARKVKQGKNTWLVFNIWIPTAKIIQSKEKMDAETRSIINKIKAVIKSTKPNMYYLNGFSALTFLIMQAVHELDLPMVTTHHGLWLKEWMSLRKDLIKSSTKYRKELEKDTVRYATKNIFLSSLSLREFEKHLVKVPKNQLEFIKIPYNPAFVNRSYPKPNKDQKLKILLVGRWDAVKNHEAYFNLAKRAKEKGLPWTFYTIANIFPYPHYDDIKNQYSDYIKVVPTMSAEELKKMYKKCNITLVPSHFDVYPGVVTESILQNRPILISANVGWVDDFKKHGIEHWITNFNDSDKVLEKIKQVSKEQVPKSLYNEVMTNNNPNYVFDKYFNLFNEIAK